MYLLCHVLCHNYRTINRVDLPNRFCEISHWKTRGNNIGNLNLTKIKNKINIGIIMKSGLGDHTYRLGIGMSRSKKALSPCNKSEKEKRRKTRLETHVFFVFITWTLRFFSPAQADSASKSVMTPLQNVINI